MVSKECCSKITGRDEISQTECNRASFEITAFEQSKLRILARPCDIYISERRAQGRGWAKFYMTRRNRTKVSSIHFQRELTLLSWRTSSARCISMHVRRGDLFKEALDLAETLPRIRGDMSYPCIASMSHYQIEEILSNSLLNPSSLHNLLRFLLTTFR